MMVLITYDVNTQDAYGNKRLRAVAKKCQSAGQRVQNSVFECDVDNSEYIKLKSDLLEIIDLEKDSLRIYLLGNNYSHRIEHFGVKDSYDPQGFLMV